MKSLYSFASSWFASTLISIPALDYWDGISVKVGAEHYVTIAQELINIYKAMGYEPRYYYRATFLLNNV